MRPGMPTLLTKPNDLIRMITPAGVVTTLAGKASRPGSTDGTNNGAQFYFPDGIALDAGGNLYITDSVNKTIRKVVPVGTNWVVTTLAGQVQVSGSSNGLGTNALFGAPSNLAVDRSTNIYVADTDNNTIRKLTPVGTNWLVSTPAGQTGNWGTTDGPATNALFHSPTDVALDGAGNLCVSGRRPNNETIRKIDTNDVVSTLAGQSSGSADGPGAAALFWSTAGVATDSAGNIYAADYYNSTIRRITTNGDVTTIAGLAGNSGSADGTNSGARFFYPFNLAVHDNPRQYLCNRLTELHDPKTLTVRHKLGGEHDRGAGRIFRQPRRGRHQRPLLPANRHHGGYQRQCLCVGLWQ